MVRKKSESFKKAKPFAPAGKLLMIQRNRLSNGSLKSLNASGVSWTVGEIHRHGTVACEKTFSGETAKSGSQKSRFKPGIRAMREIKKYQSTTKLLVPKASFSRVVREVMQMFGKGDYKFSSMAMMALQEATEMAIVNLLEVANLCCIHAKRVTLSPSDVRLTRRAFGLGHPLNG